MAKFNWRRRVVTFLKEKENRYPKQFYPSQIVKQLKESSVEFRNEISRKIKQSGRPEEEILGEFASRITSESKKHEGKPPEFKSIGSPRKYYWTDTPDDEFRRAEEDKEKENTDDGQLEKHLYNPLRNYLKNDLCVHSVLINAQKTKKNNEAGGAKIWLHPDIVGVEDLTSHWKGIIKELASRTDNKKAKKKVRTWSLEVKNWIENSTAVQYFFQAVSNSSWANFGYLAGKINCDDNVIAELRRLANLHGIGVIAIHPQEIANSKILIPARERDEIDIATCNRLAANPEFEKFVRQINGLYADDNLGDFDSEIWQIPEDES